MNAVFPTSLCPSPSGTANEALTLLNMSGAFLIGIASVVLGLLTHAVNVGSRRGHSATTRQSADTTLSADTPATKANPSADKPHVDGTRGSGAVTLAQLASLLEATAKETAETRAMVGGITQTVEAHVEALLKQRMPQPEAQPQPLGA
jgi:hypothetical protein